LLASLFVKIKAKIKGSLKSSAQVCKEESSYKINLNNNKNKEKKRATS